MTRRYRKRTSRKRVKTHSNRSKKQLRNRKTNNVLHKLPGKGSGGNPKKDHDDDDEEHRNKKVPYKRPRKLKVKGSNYKENLVEGKCRFQETNSSSEEESAGVKKSQKVIDDEKKENTKPAHKRDVPENKDDCPSKVREAIEKYAKKVGRKRKMSE